MMAVDQTARRRRIKQKPDPGPAARSLPPFFILSNWPACKTNCPLVQWEAYEYSGKPTRQNQVECLLEFIQDLLSASDPQEKLTLLT
ncbi:MAG: hypothetical protein K6U11_03185 [bacterium]|nr:hypothetical protein [bacterium]